MVDDADKDTITEPADEFRIRDLDTLRAMTDPLRMQILQQLIEGPRTVKQLAQELGVPPTKLYYHVNLLEERGLIRVVSTRVVSGIIEKRYHISAHNYPIDKSIMAVAGADEQDVLPDMITGLLDHIGRDIARSIKAGLIDLSEQDPNRGEFTSYLTFGMLTREQAHGFSERLKALLREFSAANPGVEKASAGEGLAVYGLSVALYPSTLRSIPRPKKKETGNE